MTGVVLSLAGAAIAVGGVGLLVAGWRTDDWEWGKAHARLGAGVFVAVMGVVMFGMGVAA